MKRFVLVVLAGLTPGLLMAQGTTAPTEKPIEIVPVPETKLPLKHTPEKTKADITVKDLMTRLYIFADDSMQGREAGTIGNVRGTDYIASEVKRFGLKPAGDNGTFFQTLPFKTRTIDPASSFTVSGAPLGWGSEWASNSSVSVTVPEAPVVWGGSLGDTTNQISADAAKDKVVVFMLPTGNGGRRATRSASRSAPTAAAVVVVVPDQFLGFFSRPGTFVDDPSNAPPMAPKPLVLVNAAAAAKMFDGNLDSLAAGTAGKPATLDLKVTIAPVAFPARNVVAILPGSDPKLAGEYVAIGGHNDHIGFNNRPVDHDSIRIYNHIVRPGGAEDGGKQATPEEQVKINAMLADWRTRHPNSMRQDSISNGADDDGTGSVSVLEVAEKLSAMKTKPKRSIIFVWHVGEEKGLLGSAYFTDHPTVPRDSIVAQLNMDMVGRGDAWDVTGKSKEGEVLRGNPNYVQIVGSRRLSTELGDLIEQVNKDGKHNLAFDYSMDANAHPMNIYCRSDHYEYARYGIPIAFFTTGGHSDYHQVTDEPQYIDYDRMMRVDNLVADVAVHVANLD
ncbi:MAG TPA: M28 family peptidase, partial [Gemmatimonadales bacterium]|nr:M28 family peptidase [Gemmatimonadales bacterium]